MFWMLSFQVHSLTCGLQLHACLGYAGFSELVDLTSADFAINDETMTIWIAHGKNYQLWKGDKVIIARANSKTFIR